MKGNAAPEVQEKDTVRTKDIIQLLDKEICNSVSERISAEVQCAPFRKFGLYVRIDSTGAPTTLQVKVEFLDRWSEEWFHYKQGPFAALFWEDGDTASGIREAFVGPVMGRALRVTLTDAGSDSTKYFQVSVAVDFWD